MISLAPLLLMSLPLAAVLGLLLLALIKLRETLAVKSRGAGLVVLLLVVAILSYYAFFSVQPLFLILGTVSESSVDPAQKARFFAEGISQVLSCGIVGTVLGGGLFLIWWFLFRRKTGASNERFQ